MFGEAVAYGIFYLYADIVLMLFSKLAVSDNNFCIENPFYEHDYLVAEAKIYPGTCCCCYFFYVIGGWIGAMANTGIAYRAY